MEFIDKHSWMKKIQKGVGGAVLVASLLLTTSGLEAGGKLSVQREGCRNNDKVLTSYGVTDTLTDPHGHTYNLYTCNDGAYTTGNLDHWAELDLVPQRMVVSNHTGSPQDFDYKVGGDYNVSGNIGWDYITPLSIDTTLSNQICIEWKNQTGSVTQSADPIIIDGHQGTEIYRVLGVHGLPDGAECVANFDMRLAIGASNYSGSSLHSYLIYGSKKAVPIPAVRATDLSKIMNAVSPNTANTWTVKKKAEPNTIDFGDTCAEGAVLQADVKITVSWEKISTGGGSDVTVTTVISGSNRAKRAIEIDVHDILYGTGDAKLGEADCQGTLAANTSDAICTNTFTITPAEAHNLHDKAVATYHDIDNEGHDILGSLEATASTDDPGTGTVENDTATVTEHEWITFGSNTNFTYEVKSVDGANGEFKDYTGGETIGDVYWNSNPDVSTSGQVVFNKVVHVKKAASSNGSLNDKATIQGSDSSSVDGSATADVVISASRLLTFTLTKKITESRDTDSTFTFEVKNKVGYDQTVTLTILAGHTSASETFENVDASVYNVKELQQAGWEPVEGDSSTKIIDLTEGCTGSATFTDQRADRFIDVKVGKVAFPAMIGTEDQSAGWTMTLKKETSPGVWETVSTKNTVGGGEWVILANQDNLEAKTHYKIEETMKTGWYVVRRDSGCEFTYNGNPEQADFECVYGNAKESQIIIKKETDGDTTTKFGFTQNIDANTLELSGGQSKTYTNLRSGTYTVTENNPATADSILSGLSCTDPSGNTYSDIRLGKATIALDPGETVECTFINHAIVHYPSLVILKTTNGDDAEDAPGPSILVGDPVTWEYTVTNNGDTTLNDIKVDDDKEGTISCPLTTLDPGQKMVCHAQGTAVKGAYENIGIVTDGTGVTSEDYSHYTGIEEAVDPEEDENCPCNDVSSDSSSAMGNVSAAMMILMTLMFGLYFVRREELNHANDKEA